MKHPKRNDDLKKSGQNIKTISLTLSRVNKTMKNYKATIKNQMEMDKVGT